MLLFLFLFFLRLLVRAGCDGRAAPGYCVLRAVHVAPGGPLMITSHPWERVFGLVVFLSLRSIAKIVASIYSPTVSKKKKKIITRKYPSPHLQVPSLLFYSTRSSRCFFPCVFSRTLQRQWVSCISLIPSRTLSFFPCAIYIFFAHLPNRTLFLVFSFFVKAVLACFPQRVLQSRTLHGFARGFRFSPQPRSFSLSLAPSLFFGIFLSRFYTHTTVSSNQELFPFPQE